MNIFERALEYKIERIDHLEGLVEHAQDNGVEFPIDTTGTASDRLVFTSYGDQIISIGVDSIEVTIYNCQFTDMPLEDVETLIDWLEDFLGDL